MPREPESKEREPFTAEEYVKLRKAERLLAEVQCPMTENWQKLYAIRCDLGREVYDRRPENWAELEGR